MPTERQATARHYIESDIKDAAALLLDIERLLPHSGLAPTEVLTTELNKAANALAEAHKALARLQEQTP